MCPDLAESNSRLARVTDGHCLKFRDDTPSFAMLFTLNNAQDLDPEYLKTTFLLKRTLAHEGAGEPQSGVIGVPVSSDLLKQKSSVEKEQRMFGSDPCSTT